MLKRFNAQNRSHRCNVLANRRQSGVLSRPESDATHGRNCEIVDQLELTEWQCKDIGGKR